MPERLAVIGDPIAHSLSPAMQGAALRAAGLDWSYEAVLVTDADLEDQVRYFRDAGYRGFNVTIPHKRGVMSLLDEVMPDAASVEAVNTVLIDRGRMVGYNTDIPGVIAALQILAGVIAGKEAVVFGTGGSARAAVHGLRQSGATVSVVSRDVDRARSLAPKEDAFASGDPRVLPRIRSAEIVINATPLGMRHLAEGSPLPPGSRLRSGAAVLDLVYGRRTPFLAAAEAQGCATSDGLEMLVQQGAESFRLWTGREPDLEAMRAACGMRTREVQQC